MSETWYFYMYIHVLKIILIALIPWSCWDSCWMLNRTQAWNRKQNVITLNLGGSPLSLPPLLTRTSCGVVLPLLQILLYFCWFYIGRYTSFERSMSCLGISMSALLLGCDSQKLVSEIKFFSSVFHMDFLDKFCFQNQVQTLWFIPLFLVIFRRRQDIFSWSSAWMRIRKCPNSEQIKAQHGDLHDVFWWCVVMWLPLVSPKRTYQGCVSPNCWRCRANFSTYFLKPDWGLCDAVISRSSSQFPCMISL